MNDAQISYPDIKIQKLSPNEFGEYILQCNMINTKRKKALIKNYYIAQEFYNYIQESLAEHIDNKKYDIIFPMKIELDEKIAEINDLHDNAVNARDAKYDYKSILLASAAIFLGCISVIFGFMLPVVAVFTSIATIGGATFCILNCKEKKEMHNKDNEIFSDKDLKNDRNIEDFDINLRRWLNEKIIIMLKTIKNNCFVANSKNRKLQIAGVIAEVGIAAFGIAMLTLFSALPALAFGACLVTLGTSSAICLGYQHWKLVSEESKMKISILKIFDNQNEKEQFSYNI